MCRDIAPPLEDPMNVSLSLRRLALAAALALSGAGCGADLDAGEDDLADHAGLGGTDEAPLDAWDEGVFTTTSACAKGRPLLLSGLHPDASDALRCVGVTASRISQTIGSAPASAGYH